MSSTVPSIAARPVASWGEYLRMARMDHWVKQIFVVPGIVLAALLTEAGLPHGFSGLSRLLVAVLAVCFLASANYVLNEWLDRHHDAQHPLKANRPAVSHRLNPVAVYAHYLFLLVIGLGLAWWINATFAVLAGLFVLSGVVYNVQPLRLKDRSFVDVIAESLNNPLRLALGWVAVDPHTLPPGSMLLAYWAGGAFLMTVKRLAERRFVVAQAGEEALIAYRPSLARASEHRLLEVSSLYSLISVFAVTVFLVKYRIEYVLLVPIVAFLFVLYLDVGLRTDSPAQAPERLWREPALVITMTVLIGAFLALTWIDLPLLEQLTEPRYIRLPATST